MNQPMMDYTIRPAGRGWFRVYRDDHLIAACPSRQMAELVITGLRARGALRFAQQKIALLEQTLIDVQQYRRPLGRFLSAFRKGDS